ncbi:hypothetical protein [Methanosarcina siciliae]|uniref:hypothetical protein n=1 Tax=Methanosarcina siciliae TaxID=38027 RepID=UPI0012E099E9|nr:hypothetical protein [Methanosarcina siciliae]
MKNGIRNSGVDIIGDGPWGTLFCQFYRTKEDLLDRRFAGYIYSLFKNRSGK